MANLIGTNLGVGHLGQAIYNTQTKAWEFARDHGQRFWIHLLPGALEVVSGHQQHASDDRQDEKTRSGWRDEGIRQLIMAFPDLQPARNLLSPLARVSQAVIEVVETYDPLLGDLFTCCPNGSAPMLALRDADDPGALKLLPFMERAFAWGPDAGQLWALVPANNGKPWKGSGSPIQQLCFSHPSLDYHEIEAIDDAFLAVRCLEATYIFQTGVGIQSMRDFLDTTVPSDDIADPIVVVKRNAIPGVRPADLAFNPWNNRQLAIVDRAGTCAIIELLQSSTRSKWGYKVRRKHLSIEPKSPRDQDGWVKVAWADDAATVVVATRLELRIWDAFGLTLPIPSLDLNTGNGWILDMRCSLDKPGYVFVLTSIYLFQLRVVSSAMDGATPEFHAGAHVLTNTRHYRDPKDVMLQLTLHESYDGLLVPLFLKANADTDSQVPWSCSTPGSIALLMFSFTRAITLEPWRCIRIPPEFVIPATLFGKRNARGISSMSVQSTSDLAEPERDGARSMMFILHLLLSDFSIHSLFLYRPVGTIAESLLLETAPLMIEEQETLCEQDGDGFVSHSRGVAATEIPVVGRKFKFARATPQWPLSKTRFRVRPRHLQPYSTCP